MGQLLLLVLHLFLSDIKTWAVFTSHGAAVKLSRLSLCFQDYGSCIDVILENLCPALLGSELSC